MGAGIGAALNGMRPIVEVMTVNFSLLALDQIMNNAATLRHMSGGQLNVPVVIRMTTGAGRQLAAQHSHSLEGWYAHIPGLRIVAPATLEDARGMLFTALQDPDPVLIFEHASLLNVEGEIAAEPQPVDIDYAAVRREGADVSLITYGGSLMKAMQAAAKLAEDGVSAEVIDLRTLASARRCDDHRSVAKTHRARDRGRGLEERRPVGGDHGADHGAGVLRVGCAALPGYAVPRCRSPMPSTWRTLRFLRWTASSPPRAIW